MLVFTPQCWQIRSFRCRLVIFVHKTDKLDYISMQRVTSHRSRVWSSLIVYSSTSQRKCLQIPCIFLSLEGNTFWTGVVWPVMTLSLVFIDLYFIPKKVAIDFCKYYSQLLRILFLLKLWNKKWGSPCSFKRKEAFISLSTLVWRKSLTFCTRTRWYARANDTKIVRSRDAQFNTRE